MKTTRAPTARRCLLNEHFEADMAEFEANRKSYKYIRAVVENQTFALVIKSKQIASRKRLPEIAEFKRLYFEASPCEE